MAVDGCHACLIIQGLLKVSKFDFGQFIRSIVPKSFMDLVKSVHESIPCHLGVDIHEANGFHERYFDDQSFFHMYTVFLCAKSSYEDWMALLENNPRFVGAYRTFTVHKPVKMPDSVSVPECGTVRFVRAKTKTLVFDALYYAVKKRDVNFTRALIDFGFDTTTQWSSVRDKESSPNPCRQMVLDARRKKETIDSLVDCVDDLQISQPSVASVVKLLDDMGMEP